MDSFAEDRDPNTFDNISTSTLYTDQEVKVRIAEGEIQWFPIEKEVRQGCILSPGLFNLFTKIIIRAADLEDTIADIRIGGHKINNIQYADDMMLMVENTEDLEELIKKVSVESAKAGLKLNLKKTTILATDQEKHITINGENFLGSQLQGDFFPIWFPLTLSYSNC